MQYSIYLQTKHWQETRSAKLAVKPNCQICGGDSKLQIHHKRYKDKNSSTSILFKEKATDLITLCASCHRLMHHYFGINVHKINKKICRIRRLIELGTVKKLAFYFSSQDELFCAVKEKLEKI